MAWTPGSWIVVGAPAVRFRAAQGAVRGRKGRCQERARLPSVDTLQMSWKSKSSKSLTNELKHFTIVIWTQRHIKCATQYWTVIPLMV